MYGLLNAFLLLKPSLDVVNVPEFYKLFNSSALEVRNFIPPTIRNDTGLAIYSGIRIFVACILHNVFTLNIQICLSKQ